MKAFSEGSNRENLPMPLAALGSNNTSRRMSDQGLLSKMSESSTKARRQTIAVAPAVAATNSKNHSSTKENPPNASTTTPSKTSSKHRYNLGSAQSYYFKGVSKPSVEAAISVKKRLNSSHRMDDSFGVDASFDGGLAGYNGSVAAADESFMTIVSSSSEGSDLLNKSSLSDCTELTASNFVLAASSRQRLSIASHFAPTHKETQMEVEPVQPMVEDSMQNDRAPLDTINANSKRRNTLPPGTIVGGVLQPLALAASTAPNAVRRESWQGSETRTKVNLSPGSLRSFAADMRNSRLKRQQERDQDVYRRLSQGSEVFTMVPVATLRQRSANTQRDSFPASTTTDISVRLPSLSPSSNIDVSFAASDGKDTDVSRRSLDDLFDDILSDDGGNATAKMDVSVLAIQEDVQDRTAEVGRESLDNLFGDIISSEKGDSSAAKLHTSIATATQDNFQDETAEIGRESLDNLFGDVHAEENGDTADLMDTSLVSKASMAASALGVLSTAASGTSVSPASTITTTASVSNSRRGTVSTAMGNSPLPLPSAIAFESDESPASAIESPAKSLRAGTTSPFKVSSSKRSTPTRLTPSKLTASPRRVLNTKSVDSPARNTRSASKSMSSPSDDMQYMVSPARSTRSARKDMVSPNHDLMSMVSPARSTRSVSKDKPSPKEDLKSMNSPARNTRSARKIKASSVEFSKRKRDASEEDDTAYLGVPEFSQALASSVALDSSITHDGSKHRKPSMSTTMLTSSLRKAGSAPRNSIAGRTVAFGSPEFMEFRKGSPSKSYTPLPKSLTKQMNTMVDDTVEIEADMSALMNSAQDPHTSVAGSSKINAHRAGNTPASSKKSSFLEESYPTVELEGDFQDLLAQPQEGVDTQRDMSLATTEEQTDLTETEYTVALDVDMASVLAQAATEKQSGCLSLSRVETILEKDDDAMSMDMDTSNFGDESKMDEDNTIELESDIQALLGALQVGKAAQLHFSMSESPSTISSGRRRSSMSASARRFSLAPQSRLSIATDGEVINEGDVLNTETEDSRVDISMAEEAKAVEQVLDLNGAELVQASGLELDAERDTADILTKVGQSTEELGIFMTTDAMNAILYEVCKEVDARTEPEADLDGLLSSEESRQQYLMLQNALRGQDEGVCHQLEQLAAKVRAQVESEWTNWLVSVAESLKSPFEGIKGDICDSESRINEAAQLVSETREILDTMESKAIQKAKRKSLDGRMVSVLIGKLFV